VKDHTKQTINTYNQIAADYAAEAETRPQEIERNEFIAMLPPNGSILDVGCGSGKETAFFMSQGFKVIGIDLSEALLAEAKKIHSELTVRLMDMRKLDFPDQTFDGVWANASILHLDRIDVLPTIKEFTRVLKKGGICYVFVKEGQGETLKAEEKSLGKLRFFTYFSLEEIEKYFKSAGLNIIKSYSYNGQDRDPLARNQNWIVVFGQKT
jgi:ubiquinone/menaquinone biosynthesis C-methylase UbiE